MSRFIGRVFSDKMLKTISVAVDHYSVHPKYKVKIKRTNKLFAHDENNDCKIGDIVEIRAWRPLSKKKRFILERIVKRAPQLPKHFHEDQRMSLQKLGFRSPSRAMQIINNTDSSQSLSADPLRRKFISASDSSPLPLPVSSSSSSPSIMSSRHPENVVTSNEDTTRRGIRQQHPNQQPTSSTTI
eukprot:TRINITY_DN2575_c0_g1_i1.p1 TRINITY_DN2575_c0_g1~~TRINITY_DN2575_c0_g1_i1.p1  ORF type:complete len:185 (-),score=29.42 TRINITY_DN2575_c0_g1_i1:232-786(-)